jgi:ABC-type lipoprotein release transport system permease subunit
MTALRLAKRNLRRNKRRTLLTASALAIGLTVLIISRGLLDGIDRQSIRNLILYETSYIKGFNRGWLDEDFPNLDYVIPASDSLLNLVHSLDGVEGAAERLEMSGMLIKGGDEIFVRIVGVDPAQDRDVFQTLDALSKGETISSDQPVVLVGDRLAGDLKIEPNDIVTLLVRSAPGALNPRQLMVGGLISTGNPEVDQLTVYIPFSLAREMTLLPDSATEIDIRLARLGDVDRVLKRLVAAHPEYDWRSWRYLADDFIQLARLKRTGSGIMIAILTLVAAVGLANTMIMAVHERTREIGALRAMGFSRKMINAVFLWEGCLIGIMSGIAALILGTSVVYYLSIHGISLEMYHGIDIGYPVQDAIYAMVKVSTLVKAFIFGIILSILASWGAARRAARGEVVRALREGML